MMDRSTAKAPLERIARRLRGFSGLAPPAWVVAARVEERAMALGVELAEYAAIVERDAAELARLAEELRVGETRFYRHPAQLEALGRRLDGERRRRAWSAGCSTGEEAWTLAMLLAERGDFELLATDLSETALAEARAATYPEARVAELPSSLRARFCERSGGGWRVTEAVRSRVRFEQHNLALAEPPRGLGRAPLDVVLCRNVLIYFDDGPRQETIARLAARLDEGGLLVLGSGEVATGTATLEPVRDGEALLYRRARTRAVGSATARVQPGSGSACVSDGGARSADDVVRLQGSYGGGARLAVELRRVASGEVRVVDLDGADYLDDAAARVLARLAAAAGEGLELRATRPSVRRWIERHGLGALLRTERQG